MSLKTIFITGATSGIGLETAKLFAHHGWRLILLSRTKHKLINVKIELEQHYKNPPIYLIEADVTNKLQLKQAFADLPAEWQDIDICLNNAGIALGRDVFQDSLEEDWERMLDVNIKGLVHLTYLMIPFFKKHNKGYFINLGSTGAKWVYQGGAIYCATKAAVDIFSEGLRIDLLPFDIKVSTIHPGAVETNFSVVRFKGDLEKAKKVYQGLTPLYGNDIAEVIWYLANTPKNLVVNDMVITPLAQANNYYFNRKN